MYRDLNYFEHFLAFISTVSRCVSISAFVSLIGVPEDFTSTPAGLKICALTAGVKNYVKDQAKKEKAQQ